jgi:hypothetical protein
MSREEKKAGQAGASTLSPVGVAFSREILKQLSCRVGLCRRFNNSLSLEGKGLGVSSLRV